MTDPGAQLSALLGQLAHSRAMGAPQGNGMAVRGPQSDAMHMVCCWLVFLVSLCYRSTIFQQPSQLQSLLRNEEKRHDATAQPREPPSTNELLSNLYNSVHKQPNNMHVQQPPPSAPSPMPAPSAALQHFAQQVLVILFDDCLCVCVHVYRTQRMCCSPPTTAAQPCSNTPSCTPTSRGRPCAAGITCLYATPIGAGSSGGDTTQPQAPAHQAGMCCCACSVHVRKYMYPIAQTHPLCTTATRAATNGSPPATPCTFSCHARHPCATVAAAPHPASAATSASCTRPRSHWSITGPAHPAAQPPSRTTPRHAPGTTNTPHRPITQHGGHPRVGAP